MASTDFPIDALAEHFIKTEASYDTFAAFVGTDAVRLKGVSITQPRPLEYRQDRSGSLGYDEVLQKRHDTGAVSIESYLMPSGTAGTPPDLHALLLAMTGGTDGYTNTPGTSDLYIMANNRGDTLQIGEYEVWTGRVANGAIVDSFSIEASGTDFPMLTAALSFGTYSRVDCTNVAGAEATASTAIGMTTGTGDYLEGDSVFSIGFWDGAASRLASTDDDNSGSGYLVTSVSTDDWNISPGIAGAGLSGGEEARVVTPAQTTAGSPLAEGGHSFTYAGSSFDIVSFKVEFTMGSETKNDELTSTGPHDALRSAKREGNMEISFHLRKDRFQPLVDAFTNTSAAAVLTLGTVAGSRCTLTMNNFRAEDWARDIGAGNDGQIVATVSGKILESSAGAGNELQILFS